MYMYTFKVSSTASVLSLLASGGSGPRTRGAAARDLSVEGSPAPAARTAELLFDKLLALARILILKSYYALYQTGSKVFH